MPRGLCIFYHAPERTIGVPKSPTRGNRRAGGTNSLTRLKLKPVLMVGGYAQHCYRFNDYGPPASDRDTLRDRAQARRPPLGPAERLDPTGEVKGDAGMNVRAQVSMVFHLDKCIGCHTCSLACKNLWTDRQGTEYMWWNNVETKPGTGYPTLYEDQEKYRGGWDRRRTAGCDSG